MKRVLSLIVLLASIGLASTASAQGPVLVQATTPSQILVIPISATAAAGSTATLTIPAPPGSYSNYICSLAYELSNNNTGTAISVAVCPSPNSRVRRSSSMATWRS